jgi:Domain of unknown function (DUF4124)
MRKQVFIAAIALLVTATAAFGVDQGGRNRYKWRDGQGNLHYDDALPDEALKYGYDVLNPSGIVVKHVERPRTAEELAADKATADKAATAKRAQDDQLRKDQQMLAAYPTEQDLQSAQREQLAVIDQTVEATQASLQNQEKSLREMLQHAADLERTGKAVSATLKQQIDDLSVSIEKQKAYIAGKHAEKESSAKRFESELVHYREVQARLGSQR